MLLAVSTLSADPSGAMLGLLRLSAVPPIIGIVATLFGTRDPAMLGGIVVLSHRLGPFLGSWLGGVIVERTGSSDLTWGILIALGVVAALVNLPIRGRPAATAAAGAGR